MKKLRQELQELKELFINGIVSREYYFRELDELLKYAQNKDEILLINTFKNLDV